MKKSTKLLIAGISALAVGSGLYLYFKKGRATPASSGASQPNPGSQGGSSSTIEDIYGSATRNAITLAQLQAKQWKNQAGFTIPSGYIAAYEPLTGMVLHGRDKLWVGKLVDANTITWRHANGSSDTWKAGSGVSGFSSAIAGVLR